MLFAFWEWIDGGKCYLKGFFLKDPQQRLWDGSTCSLGPAQSVLLKMFCLLLHVLLDGHTWYSAYALGGLGYVVHVSSPRETSQLSNVHRKCFGSKMVCVSAGGRKRMARMSFSSCFETYSVQAFCSCFCKSALVLLSCVWAGVWMGWMQPIIIWPVHVS